MKNGREGGGKKKLAQKKNVTEIVSLWGTPQEALNAKNQQERLREIDRKRGPKKEKLLSRCRQTKNSDHLLAKKTKALLKYWREPCCEKGKLGSR